MALRPDICIPTLCSTLFRPLVQEMVLRVLRDHVDFKVFVRPQGKRTIRPSFYTRDTPTGIYSLLEISTFQCKHFNADPKDRELRSRTFSF